MYGNDRAVVLLDLFFPQGKVRNKWNVEFFFDGHGVPIIFSPRQCNLSPRSIPLVKKCFFQKRYYVFRFPVGFCFQCLYRGSLQLLLSLKLAFVISLPQILFPARLGFSMKKWFRSLKYRSIAIMHSSTES